MRDESRSISAVRTTPILIGVTGGIGAGKSVVCRACALRGFPLYDCDLEARRLMDESADIKRGLQEIVGADVVSPEGVINRGLLAERLFDEADVRDRVNRLVHAAVRRHLAQWLASLNSHVAIVESAIMHTSHLDEMTRVIWLVDAPEQLRVQRVQQRNGLDRDRILSRMAAQAAEFAELPPDRTSLIINDGITPLLPQIDKLLNSL